MHCWVSLPKSPPHCIRLEFRRRRCAMLSKLAAVVLAFVVPCAAAQDYPHKPVRLIVPFPPGGSVDLVARLVGKSLQDALKQPFVVDNKPGASGNVGAAYVAKAPADGYTLLVGSAGVFAANQFLYANPPFDPLQAFAPVMLIVDQPNILDVGTQLKRSE